MALPGIGLSSEPLYRMHDVFNVPDSIIVTFVSPDRGLTVRGILAAPLTLNVSSQWKGWIESPAGGWASLPLSVGDTLMQLSRGLTLREPFFARKLWQGTDPPSLTVKMNFFAAVSGYENVWRPCADLLGLAYPRITMDGKSYNIPGPALLYSPDSGSPLSGLTGVLDKLTGGMVTKASQIVSGVSNVISGLRSLKSGAASTTIDVGGDNVTIQIGKIVQYQAAYVTNVSIELSNVMHSDGYPMSATVSVTFEPIDNLFVNADGTFMMEGLAPAVSQVPGYITNITNAAGDAVKGLQGAAKDAIASFGM